MLSRQAMRQNKAAVPIKPFMYLKVLAHLLCPSGASLHYAFCHTFCYSYSVRHGSYLCPFATLHSLRPTFRYHYTTFVPILMLHFMASHQQAHKSQHTGGSTFHFAKPTLQYSLGFIIASLRPTFISVGFSPLAANNFACLACLPRLRVCHGF